MKLFVFAGIGEEGPLNTVEMYSPQTETFVMVAPIKLARCCFASCRVGNLIFIIGGSIGHDNTMKREISSVEVYDINTDT